jgi:hypothetical protein
VRRGTHGEIADAIGENSREVLSTFKQLFRKRGTLSGEGGNQQEKTSRDPHPDSRRVGSFGKPVSNHKRGEGCTGYLDHPFKNEPSKTGKDLLPLLANTGGSV